MTNALIIAALIAPAVLLILLRVNAAMTFLSLCMGFVLVEFTAKDANSLVAFLAPNTDSPSASNLRLIILFLPAALTVLFTAFSVKGSRRIVNILPAIGVGVLVLVLAEPQLTPGLRHSIEALTLWKRVVDYRSLLIAVGAVASLFVLWSHRKSHHDDRRGRR